MRIALFGGTGFIGKEVIALLKKNQLSFFQVSRHAGSIDSFQADITDLNALNAIHENADVVIICASILPKSVYSDEDVRQFIDINIVGIHNILRWARDCGASKVIYCSTLSMLPLATDPTNEKELIDISSHGIYKITKSAGEHLVMAFCKQHNINFIVHRIASVYGQGMRNDIIHLISDKIETSAKFTITNASFTIDFVHVKDVAKTIVATIASPDTNKIINVASGEMITLQGLAETISHILGKTINVEIKKDDSLPPRIYNNASMKRLIGNDLISLEQGLRNLLTNNLSL